MIKERLKRLGVFGLALSLMIQPLTTLADTNKNIKQFINNVDTKVELTEVETGAETEDEDTLDIVSSTEECDESENIEISTETYEVETEETTVETEETTVETEETTVETEETTVETEETTVETEETTVETEETTVETEETTEILDDSIINIVNDTSSSDIYVIDGVSYDINNAVCLSNEYSTGYYFEDLSALLVTNTWGTIASKYTVYPWYNYSFETVIFVEDSLDSTYVSAVPQYAFKYNDNIKYVYLPDSIETISNQAFFGCSNLEYINLKLPKLSFIGTEAFWNCSSLNISLDLKDCSKLKTIEPYAFAKCSSITGDLILPDSIMSIGGYAFQNCGLDGNLKFGNNQYFTIIRKGTFYECKFTGELNIPETVTSIQEYAFKNCSGFTGTLKLPQNLTNIGGYTFQNCSGFTGTLKYPEGVTGISLYSFAGCTGLENIEFHDKITRIQTAAFKGCTGLKTLDLPDSSIDWIMPEAFMDCTGLDGCIEITCQSLQDYAFYNCSNIDEITFNDRVTSIEDSVFEECKSISGNLKLPESLLSIGKKAFYGCSNLTGDLIIPKSCGSIDSEAFRYCSGFDGDLIIKSNIYYLNEYTFADCTGLTGDLNISGCTNLMHIYEGCFMNCENLSGNFIYSKLPYSVGNYAFANCSNLKGSLDFSTTYTYSIGNYAFANCSNLSGELILPSSSNLAIGSHAFENCINFSGNLTIPEYTKTIGDYAFANCIGFTGSLILNNKTLGINTTTITYDSNGNKIEKTTYAEIIPAGEKAFYNLSNITNIVGNGLTEYSGTNNCFGPITYDPNIFGLEEGQSVKTTSEGMYIDSNYKDKFWEINRYPITVKFISDGNTISEYDIFYSDNNKITLPENPTKEGYAFVKWNYKVDNELTELTSDTYVTRDLALSSSGDSYILEIEAEYATTYDITFDTGTDKQIEKQTIKENEKAIKPTEELTKEGYTFDCWLLNGKEYDFDTPVTSDITLVAKWNINNYIIKFDSNGGNQIENQTVEYNSNVKEPDNPVRENYNFIGWFIDDVKYDFSTPVKSDITLVAKWNIKTYSVYFDSTGGSSIAKQEVIHNGNAKEPENPTKDNCKFLGWYSDKDCENKYDFNSPVTSDITLYAKWLDTFTITFDSNGGKCDIPSKIVAITEPYGELPIPTKEQHEFSGWFTEKDNGVQVVSDTIKETDKDEILYAHWNEYQYTIKFDANGGKGEMTDITLKYSEENKLSKNKFTRKGYKFIGWSTDKNAKTAEYKNQESVSKLTSENNKEVTLYAVWKKQTTPTTVNDTPEEPTPTPSSSNEQQTSSTSTNTTQVSVAPQVIENVKTSDNQNIFKLILVLIVGALAIVLGINTKTNKK